MRIIRASEINSYIFCQRAWWYQKNDNISDQQAGINEGEVLHLRHGRKVLVSGVLRSLAFILIGLAIILFTFYIVTETL